MVTVETRFKQSEVGMIPEHWEVRELGSLANITTGKLDSNQAEENGRYPFFTCAPKPLRINSYSFDGEALLLAGNNADGVFHTHCYNGKFNAYQRTYVITAKDNSASLRYLLYQLSFRLNYLKEISQGTATRFLTKVIVNGLKIPVPDMPEQIGIATILSNLDYKIELNQQMSRTLDAIARAIFKRWFVDFEFPNEKGKPYRSSGGEMVRDEEFGKEVPTGWKVGKLADFMDLDKGLSYKGEFLSDDGIPLVNLGTIAPGAGFIREGLKHYVGEYKEKHLVRAGDIVIANTDITQNREVLGSPMIVPPYLASETALFTHHIFAVRNESNLPTLFIYYLLQTTRYRDRVKGFATGTTVLALPRDAISDFAFAVPDENFLKRFDSLCSVLIQKANSSTLESMRLAQIRDSLLPKLMSGKIRVPAEVR